MKPEKLAEFDDADNTWYMGTDLRHRVFGPSDIWLDGDYWEINGKKIYWEER